MTNLESCNPSLRQRIAQQLAADLAIERERRAAPLTQAEQTEGVAGSAPVP